MKLDSGRANDSWSVKGFTIVESMVVIVVAAILIGISAPLYSQWVHNIEYRASARNIYYLLREAKSKSIATNLEHKMEFEDSRKRYRVVQGNRATDSNDWSKVVYDWVELPAGVFADANVKAIHLNPMGTANPGTIAIQDGSRRTRYEVRVARTGRIRIPTFF